MNTSTLHTPRPAQAWHEGGHIHVRLADGKDLVFPVAGNPRLERGTPDQLNHIELSPFGLHWPHLDEDLALEGILQNNWGQLGGTASIG
jgi:hypothetical protein